MTARLLLLPLLFALSGCYSLTCPAEFATPFERARFCGQGQAGAPAAYAISPAALPPGTEIPAVTTVIHTERMTIRR